MARELDEWKQVGNQVVNMIDTNQDVADVQAWFFDAMGLMNTIVEWHLEATLAPMI